MSDLQAGWDAAVEACLTGHEGCSYGGPTPGTGYWMASVECGLDHHDHCAWCSAEPSTGFAGWGSDGWSVWAVPACGEHAAEWAAGHPEWSRPEAGPEQPGAVPREDSGEPRAEFDGLLASLGDEFGFVDLFAEHARSWREQMQAFYRRQWEEAVAVETRQLWSGPDRVQRMTLRAFGMSVRDIGLAPRSVFTSEYRRRQRARVKRRRR